MQTDTSNGEKGRVSAGRHFVPGEDELTYDTTDPKATINAPGFAFLGDILKLAAEAAYTIVLDGNNKVKAIEGTEEFSKRSEKLDPRTQDLVRGEFEADTFKKIAEQRLQFLPDVLARQGESMGAHRDPCGRRRSEFHPPQEIRISWNRETGSEDFRQDYLEGARGETQHGPQQQTAIENDQERPEG